ncbi:uncharacterized protein LY79DRAFT_152027 [Colletotrichum navitas]|uniref:Uncharacterized protein n=1 Tax=Colletotrichum navitas TaxID=681940 RepID=A0AAD8QD32_9PEZI|nr:uncharacterized protein LY79DRAFT_152027 [Colletotrichum navitas]KAK1599801.1 hypothetical protein LY79DRAFT_152027 [Colletotrichum navitas]
MSPSGRGGSLTNSITTQKGREGTFSLPFPIIDTASCHISPPPSLSEFFYYYLKIAILETRVVSRGTRVLALSLFVCVCDSIGVKGRGKARVQ